MFVSVCSIGSSSSGYFCCCSNYGDTLFRTLCCARHVIVVEIMKDFCAVDSYRNWVGRKTELRDFAIAPAARLPFCCPRVRIDFFYRSVAFFNRMQPLNGMVN